MLTLLGADGHVDPVDVDRLRARLGAPSNPLLFPGHFLKATFPKIGGRIADFDNGGVGFLFPRAPGAYTMRAHGPASVEPVARALDAHVTLYAPVPGLAFEGEPGEIGRPSAAEAGAVRDMQAEIWGSRPDDLYPADLHAPAFGVSSLVARGAGELSGFLFGFGRLGGPPLPETWAERYRVDLRLESQLLGVAPRSRARGTATRLKLAQAERARAEGIDVVHWTVDPLQFPNAVMNFGRLRAVAFDYYPRYYDFSNRLNRVAAARLCVTWLVGSRRVREPVESSLSELRGARVVNYGHSHWRAPEGAAMLAIEVPADWTALQSDDVEEARRWREATDAFFREQLGVAEGKYVLTGAARGGEKCYLVAERSTPELLATLAA